MGFLSSLAGGLMDTAANVGLSLYGMNRQEHENRMNYNRQIEMWKMNNEYNTPANQMKRYKEAGLNPNLIYGQTNTAQMPNNDAGFVNPNFDKINMFSNALDGYENAKEAEATLKRLEEQKAYDRKRQEIIDNRQAKAFEMEMKLKQAQIDNIKAKPYIEAQKAQLQNQKLIDKQHNKVERELFSNKNFWRSTRVVGSLGARKLLGEIPSKLLGKAVGPFVGSLWPAIEMGLLFNDYANYITDKKTLDKASDIGRKISPLATQYEENIWRKLFKRK